jgi:hypothetical protein
LRRKYGEFSSICKGGGNAGKNCEKSPSGMAKEKGRQQIAGLE